MGDVNRHFPSGRGQMGPGLPGGPLFQFVTLVWYWKLCKYCFNERPRVCPIMRYLTPLQMSHREPTSSSPLFRGKLGLCTLPLQISEPPGHMRHADGDTLETAAEIEGYCS